MKRALPALAFACCALLVPVVNPFGAGASPAPGELERGRCLERPAVPAGRAPSRLPVPAREFEPRPSAGESASRARRTRPSPETPSAVRVHRHPSGALVSIPASWRATRDGTRLVLAPDGAGPRGASLALAAIEHVPAHLDDVQEAAAAIRLAAIANDRVILESRDLTVNGLPAHEVAWTQLDGREVGREVAVLSGSTLHFLSMTAPAGAEEEIRSVYDDALLHLELR